MELTQALKAFARSIGIDHIGIGGIEPFTREEALLNEQLARGEYPAFTERDVKRRCHPRELLPDAASFIAVAVCYLTDDPPHPPCHDGEPRAWLSRYAWGDADYHRVLRDRLEQIIAFLQRHVSFPVKAVPYVDTGPPVDRAVAERAGLGWFGKNNCFYVPGHGSWVFLGEIITNVPLVPDPPQQRSCGTCTRCIAACPTQAITGPFRINPNRCLSYITQMPGVIPHEFRRPMGRMLFGCDICQMVCPWNREAQPANRPEFRPRPALGTRPKLLPLLTMTNRQFQEWFGGTPMAWRGKKIIQRNACICLGNIGRPEAVPALIDRLRHDPKEEVRGAAAWALGQIGGEGACEALRTRLGTEPSEYVRSEIAAALEEAARRRYGRPLDKLTDIATSPARTQASS